MFIKIFAMGFIMNKKAYIRDLWNVIDFVIVITGYFPLFLGQSTVNLSSLRALRILRPLRTINKIKPLRDIVQALFSAFSLLRDSVIILVFFYTIFAIAGLQLFMGILKRRCFSRDYGFGSTTICLDDSSCDFGFTCGKMIANPDWGLSNFDTFGWSIIQVYMVCSMEGWTHLMAEVQLAFSPWIAIYFILCVLIGGFFVINLVLAIIKVKFSEAQERKDTVFEVQDEYWNLSELRTIGVLQHKAHYLSTEDNRSQSFYGTGAIYSRLRS
jgi:heme/copper-type cytochrome/quinol oxidase subunit 3